MKTRKQLENEYGLFALKMKDIKDANQKPPSLWFLIPFQIITLPIGLAFAVTFWFWIPLGLIITELAIRRELKSAIN